MLVGLRLALTRVFLGMLVGIGVVAMLFRSRRSRAIPAVPIPLSKARSSTTARWRGPVVALLCCLLAIGVVLALGGVDGAHRRLVTGIPSGDTAGGSVSASSTAAIGAGRTQDPKADASREAIVKIDPGRQGGGSPVEPFATRTPTFDLVRFEPSGEAVIAGQAPPNGTVDLLVDGKPVATAVADAGGRFALMPHTLPAGNSEIGLRTTDVQGQVRHSSDSVAVAVSPSRADRPLVALTSPDRPTVVLSRPDVARATGTAPDAGLGPQAQTGPGSVPPGQHTEGRQTLGRIAPGTVTAARGAASLDDPGQGLSDRGMARPGAGNGDDAVNRSGQIDGPGSTATEGKIASTDPGKVTRPIDPQDTESEVPVKIVSIDAQDGGRLFVTGHSAAGTTVRLYLNDTLIATAGVGREGTVTFTIGRGVKPGAYDVRLDQVDAATGKVRSRVEVPFTVPDGARIAGNEHLATEPSGNAGGGVVAERPNPDATPPSAFATDARPRDAKAAAASPPSFDIAPQAAIGSPETTANPPRDAAGPSDVFVPEVRTARIERGDSLWEISRRTYGAGDRYTVIYDANQDQIRSPDLIYPGQIFVLPGEGTTEAGKDDKRG